MASPISETYVHCTVRISHSGDEGGTGFLVSRTDARGAIEGFLVTNRHVLFDPEDGLRDLEQVDLHVNVGTQDGETRGAVFTLDLFGHDGLPIWRDHFDSRVDVLVFNITEFMTLHPEISRSHKWLPYKDIPDRQRLRDLQVTIGEEVYVLGYPDVRYRHASTNYPIVKAGLIASIIGEESLQEERIGEDPLILPGAFLVDGLTVYGASGSPVVLRPTVGRIVYAEYRLNLGPQPLVGIIARTTFSRIKGRDYRGEAFGGLALAFDAQTIRKTIDRFPMNLAGREWITSSGQRVTL